MKKVFDFLKKHATQANITTLLAVITVILASGVIDFTPDQMNWIYLAVGILGAFGYNVESFKAPARAIKNKIKKSKEEPEKVKEVEIDASNFK